MSKITKRNMPRSMPTIAAADETDACFDTIELRERERERGRTRETLPPPTREYAQSPILEIMSVIMFRFFRKTWNLKNPNPVVKKPKSSVTTRSFKWQNGDDRGGGTTTGRWFI
jgi:hypothetical protein